MTTNDDGKSVFAQYIVDSPPEKEQIEPDIVRRGPQPIIPPPHPRSRPNEKLLDFLVNHWPKPTISARDIGKYGPNATRDQKNVIYLTKILVEYGWLIPIATRRRDMKKWQIVRELGRHAV
jgi:hypothetical protein